MFVKENFGAADVYAGAPSRSISVLRGMGFVIDDDDDDVVVVSLFLPLAILLSFFFFFSAPLFHFFLLGNKTKFSKSTC